MIIMNKQYKPYSEYELHLLFTEPREVSDRPYLLHAAYLISCLFEAYEPDDDEERPLEKCWNWKIPQSVLNSIVKNANEQFLFASKNGTQIDVWGQSFSIRKVNAYDPKRLNLIFDFPQDGEDYMVTPEGILNLAGSYQSSAHKAVKMEYEDNKSYLRKVIMVAEDDANGGWGKLTDMEVTMYLWAIFYRKYENENDFEFRTRFKKDLYTTEKDDCQCWNDLAKLHKRPNGLYTFSACKVRAWNKQHEQLSIIDNMDSTKADDYWYNVAIKTSCK